MTLADFKKMTASIPLDSEIYISEVDGTQIGIDTLAIEYESADPQAQSLVIYLMGRK